MIYEVIIALMILQVTRELFLKMKRKERLCLCFPGEGRRVPFLHNDIANTFYQHDPSDVEHCYKNKYISKLQSSNCCR